MKSSLRKLRNLAGNRHGFKDKSTGFSGELQQDPEDVTSCMQEVEEMHSHYEGLVTNANIISGSAFDFSRSLQEMASYMVEVFGQLDGDIGNVFSMLAKVQFEISKLLDLFANHVSQAIITPTEMLLREIQQVQVMKEQYDETRQAYHLLQKEKKKGKPKNVKREDHASSAEKEDCLVNNLRTKMQALTQGLSHKLIAQAAGYHAAQMHLFSKGLESIDAVEPFMKQVALEKSIDRSLPENDVEILDAPIVNEDIESFISSPMEPCFDDGGRSKEPSKLENNSNSFPLSLPINHHKEGLPHVHDVSLEHHGNKVSMYTLPSPTATGGNLSGFSLSEEKASKQRLGKSSVDSKYGMTHEVKWPTCVDLSNDRAFDNNAKFDSHSLPIADSTFGDARYRPLKDSADSTFQSSYTPPLYKSGPVGKSSRVFTSQNMSGPLLSQSFTSQNMSVPVLSSLQISELHKLPPPPAVVNMPPTHITYSAPLGKKVEEMSALSLSSPPSPLPPPPPGLVTRSLSTPSSSSEHLHVAQLDYFPSPTIKPMIPVTAAMFH